jgi:flagellar hook-length control protein FliK
MPLATNALLQANSTTASKTSAANNSVKPADNGKDDNSSFSDVYAKQAQAKSAVKDDAPVKSARDKSVADKDQKVADKPSATDDDAAAAQTTVADSGNSLPVDPAAAGVTDETASTDDEVIDPALLDPTLLDAQVPDPTLDPTLQALAAQPPVVPVQAAAEQVQAQLAPTSPQVAAALAASSTATQAPVAAPVSEAPFDPNADPLEGMPALQFALESAGAKSHAATQNATNAAKATNVSGDDNADPAQTLANNLAALTERLPSEDASTESSDKSFDGLIDGGLKDIKSASGDTRMDNFADRLAALSQAAQAPRAAQSPSVPLLNQPLAMHQSGWSEGVVDRVMYLSSQNLKSAEIQLEPAELGRLDIRVNMAPDQQTQVTFMSAHVGVREALESQMSRLRESFSQQGMGQVDVNVSDQNRGWQQQGQEQANNNNQRGTGSSNGASGDLESGVEDGAIDAAVAVSQPAARVIGSSEVDYYA